MHPEPVSLTLEQAIGQRLLLAFEGKGSLAAGVKEAIRRYRPGGFTLFRALNIQHPAQVRQLTTDLQRAAAEAGLPRLLIAADQEGGQLMAIGEGTTQLPGNMALGATGSAELARRAGEVLGRELAAMGLNVDYAPSCDVNINPRNPVIGTRSFGEDPQSVSELGAAMIAGIQSAGVAATAKHFPGHGDTASDSHYGIQSVPHTMERLRQVELPPFIAAARAGVRLMMTAHLALPAVDGREDLPATLSPAILTGLLRREIGFKGVIVTDAMDMKAIQQGEKLGEDAVRAAAAGADLLLLTSDPASHRHVFERLQQAARSSPGSPLALSPTDLLASAGRVLALKAWLASQPAQPDLNVVGCPAHQAIAAEIAERSITLVRDQGKLLPLRLHDGQRLAVILPAPLDLTPADTSSFVTHTLPQALRRYNTDVDEYILPPAFGEQDIPKLLRRIQDPNSRYATVIFGTINAFAQPVQTSLAKALTESGIPAVIVSLRMPYDLASFREAPTYLCAYSLLEPSMYALAGVLFGQAPATGRLPVSIPGLYPLGYRLNTHS